MICQNISFLKVELADKMPNVIA